MDSAIAGEAENQYAVDTVVAIVFANEAGWRQCCFAELQLLAE